MASMGVIEHWVPRSVWDARAPRCVSSLPVSSVNRVFFHYTASFADLGAAHPECASRWRGVQQFHQNTRGWCDIAYTIGVCPHGFAYEGRGLGKRTAATGNCNSDSYAVVFMGHDKVGRQDVGSAAKETLAECHAEIERQKGKTLPRFGHRDCGSTACPGDELYVWIRSSQFRSLVNAQKAGGELLDVWQLRAGKRTLKQIRAGTVDGRTALERIIRWQLQNQRKVAAAEREHGAVALRRVKVPA